MTNLALLEESPFEREGRVQRALRAVLPDLAWVEAALAQTQPDHVIVHVIVPDLSEASLEPLRAAEDRLGELFRGELSFEFLPRTRRGRRNEDVLGAIPDYVRA
jgi:hypothetical protein